MPPVFSESFALWRLPMRSADCFLRIAGASIRLDHHGLKWFCLWLSGEGNGTPLQYSCLENPMDGGAWWATVHGVARIRTQLSDFTFTFHFHALEKEMATLSSVLALRIPGMGEPGGLPSMGLHKVGHDWSDLAAAAALPLRFLWCRKQWVHTGIAPHY